jgi:hypothetical protein
MVLTLSEESGASELTAEASGSFVGWLVADAPLVRTGNTHVFAILGDGSSRDLDALRLQNAGNLLIGQRSRWIFLFTQFLYAKL